MTNKEIAKLFRKVAAAYTLKNENRFKILAYEKAADTLENSTFEAKDLWKEGKLANIPGIGKTIASHLDEIFRTGKAKHFKSVFTGLPESLFTLMNVSGFGARKAYKLARELALKNPDTAIDDLLDAAKSGKIAPIAGFGDKSQSDIIEAIKRFKRGQVKENRMPLPFASAIAQDVLNYLKIHKETKAVWPLGSLRRLVATIGDIDIAVSTTRPEATIDWFMAYPQKASVVEKGPGGATILLTNGTQVDLRVQHPAKFGAMLQYFTGSKNHNIRLRELALKMGYSLNEYGIKPMKKSQISKLKSQNQIRLGQNYNSKLKIFEFAKEEEFYNALNIPWIPPELREDRGEIEAAKANRLPELVEVSDIKGDVHIHSNYDLEPSHDLGVSSVEELVKKAEELNYEYIGISDHNPSVSNHNPKQIISIIKARNAIFEQILQSTKSTRVKLLIMMETDILPDGKLPIPNEGLNYLDATIVSIHSSFQMDRNKMTERIIMGLSYPKAKILAHPSGRLIGSREGYELDWNRLFKFCKAQNKALEINSFPNRLDLSDLLVREAVKTGVKLVINTDSHEVSQMQLMPYGVSVARRGWAQKSDILNTLTYNQFKNWLVT